MQSEVHSYAALLPSHRELLKASAIAPEIVAARGYRSVDAKVVLERYGFSRSQQRVPALLIPVWDVHGEIATYQSRPDDPRTKDGRRIKYETPAKTRLVLDVPPPARQWLGDPGRPLFVTEGARKADAAVSRGLCTIGLLGVWSWRGSNGEGGKTALPDWELIALNEREVLVVFDSDVALKNEVQGALARLKAFLESRRARVRVIYLPAGEGGAKVGLDDFLATGGTVEELLALATPDLLPATRGKGTDACYERADDGLVWNKPTREGPLPIQLTNFSAVIIGDVAEDDGAEIRRVFELEATLSGRTATFTVPAERFAGMAWVTEQLGAEAVIYPGFSSREHARVAIQLLSGRVPQRRVFTHSGWRSLEVGWCFLHGGGALGAEGQVPGVVVELPAQLAGFRLPEPSGLVEAIRASLRLYELAPDPVVIPLHAAVVRAPLGRIDFAIHLAGQTGIGKSELAALAQQHFGSALDARHLPGSWSSTGNALEGLAFVCKDALLVVDDFAPGGSQYDVQRAHREADRVLRAQGNQSGRLRMRPDGTLRPQRAPRGLILSTGEDIPRGQSLRARLLVLELEPDALDWAQLSAAQREAAEGVYARALAGYIQWLAPRLEELSRALPGEATALRAFAASSAQHRRTPEIVANLALGLRLFYTYALDVGAINEDEAASLWQRAWTALGTAALAQAQQQAASEPTGRFLELLAAALASGRAHIAAPDGGFPENPSAWGWRERTGTCGEWQPGGERVGWLGGDELLLEPTASFTVAQRMAGDAGEGIPIGSKTLHKRMDSRGLLVRSDGGGRLTARRQLEGQRRRVLHLNPASLSREPGQSVQAGQQALNAGDSGPLSGPITPPLRPESDQRSDQKTVLESQNGPIGPIGPILEHQSPSDAHVTLPLLGASEQQSRPPAAELETAHVTAPAVLIGKDGRLEWHGPPEAGEAGFLADCEALVEAGLANWVKDDNKVST